MPVTRRVFDRYPTTKTETSGVTTTWEVLSAAEAAGNRIRIDSVIMMSWKDASGSRELTLVIGGEIVAIAPLPAAADTYSTVVLHDLWSDGESIEFTSANLNSPGAVARATITYSVL